jgi:hypothetical protein
MQPSWEMEAEALTERAVLAAGEGKWNAVDACYRQRAELFRANDAPASLATRLGSLDDVISNKLRIAMMTVQHLQTEAASKQRCLERFDVAGEAASNGSQRINRLV